MRVTILFTFATVLMGQTPPVVERILGAQALYNSGDVLGAERELIDLVSVPEAAAYDSFALAAAWSNLGVMYQDMTRASDAERSYEKARALLEKNARTPESHALWLQTVNNLASMYLEIGQPGKAERLVKVLMKAEAPESDDAARIRGTIASLKMVREKNREAETLFRSLLTYWEQRGRMKECAVVLNNLGVLALRRRDAPAAVSALSRSVESWKEALGADHPTSLAASANYGHALLLNGQRNAAEEVLERALSIAKRSHGEATPMVTHITGLYSVALQANGRKEEAKRMKKEAERTSSALASTDPARHTVDVLDLMKKR